jgi:hypothetical protein
MIFSENRYPLFRIMLYLAGAVDGLTAYNMAASTKLFCKDDGVAQ